MFYSENIDEEDLFAIVTRSDKQVPKQVLLELNVDVRLFMLLSSSISFRFGDPTHDSSRVYT